MPNNTVLILGKGPSAQMVAKDDPRMICALNGAARLCGRVDWLFLNDVTAIEEITESCVGVTRNLVVPSELHEDTAGKRTRPFDLLPDWLVERPSLHIYQLPTAKKRRDGIPDFGEILSVGETAVAWMLYRGYREFETAGIDAAGGYHEVFADGWQVRKPQTWFRRNWRRMENRIDAAGGTIRRLPFEDRYQMEIEHE